MQLEENLAKELASIIKEQFATHAEQIKAFETRLAVVEACKPEKGDRGEKGDKGDRGDSGLRGETGIPGRDGKDGRDGERGLIGPQGEQGLPGLNGKDGIDGKDGAGPSRGRNRGPWTGSVHYHQDDMVSCGGSGWVAMVDGAKGRPGDSKDWQLFVKKGRDGKDGERGERGPIGPAGKDYA